MYKVLVTGGTRGIGKGVAEYLTHSGYEVFTCARDESAMIRCDVTSREQVEAMEKQIGSIDVLINNAGASLSGPFLKTTEEDWDRLYQLNVKGVVYCTRAFLPGMLSRKWGRIINIASTAGLIGYRYITVYAATKHAVVGLTRALALEVAEQGVTVNAVCPSYVDTPMLRNAAETIARKTGKDVETIYESFRAASPQKRLIPVEDVAAAVRFLIETSSVNGQALCLCGGLTAS